MHGDKILLTDSILTIAKLSEKLTQTLETVDYK